MRDKTGDLSLSLSLTGAPRVHRKNLKRNHHRDSGSRSHRYSTAQNMRTYHREPMMIETALVISSTASLSSACLFFRLIFRI